MINIFSLESLKLIMVFLGIPLLLVIWKWKDFRHFFKKLDKFDIGFLAVHLSVMWVFLILLPKNINVKISNKTNNYILAVLIFIIIISIWWLFYKIIDKQKMSFKNNGQDCRLIGGALTFFTITVEIILFFLLKTILL